MSLTLNLSSHRGPTKMTTLSTDAEEFWRTPTTRPVCPSAVTLTLTRTSGGPLGRTLVGYGSAVSLCLRQA